MKRKILLSCLCVFLFSLLHAQQYGNEWINYNNTYYKFKLGPSFGVDDAGWPISNGIVRVTQPVLAAAGMGAVPAEQLQLWRNGKQVAIYVSTPTGILSPSDYIEFWGQIEDGGPDKNLYSDTAYQLNSHWSLETDSAAYFFTANPSGNNLRLTQAANNAASANIQPDNNFMYTVTRYYRSQINPGSGVPSEGLTLYSSSYDNGEGFSSRFIGPSSPMEWTCTTPYVDVTGSAATATVSAVGTAFNLRNVDVSLNNNTITQFPLNFYNSSVNSTGNIAPSALSTDTASFLFQDNSGTSNDNFVVASASLSYPRLFNFGGQSSFEFTLAASTSGRLIHITNFSANGSLPVLYDLANGLRYTADSSIPNTLSFLLTPSSQAYNLVLVRGDGSTAVTISSLQQENFINFGSYPNQGNYLIISNPLLYGTPGSTDYINQYSQYRQSQQGGSYITQVIDINQLYDQFAYGVSHHPLAIKNFLQFARQRFSLKPAFAFLIGKGLTYDAYRNNPGALAEQLDLVPTFGDPGSDNLLASANYDPIPATFIGRLSAISPQEIGGYLAKLIQYEAVQQDTSQSVAAKGWMKNVLQLTGEDDPTIGSQLDGYMNTDKSIIGDTLFGANVTLYSKSANPTAYPQMLSNFTNTFNQGSSIVNYLGHASSTSLDFGLASPSNYNNAGKYPLFIVNGCLSGNIFDYDPARLTVQSTVSEKFVLAPGKGAIGYLASSNYDVLSYISTYTTDLFQLLTNVEYGASAGEVVTNAINTGFSFFGPSDFYGRIHAEQLTFHGDPALKINSFAKPDYAVTPASITLNPSFISVADDSFTVKVVVNNQGRATNDSVHFSLYRRFPNGDNLKVFAKEFASISVADSITVSLPVIANRDNGQVTITAVINDNQAVQEMDYTNNTASKTFTISSAELLPVYPYNYSIVSSSNITLSASTANPLDTVKQYEMQLDTTALFNSPLMVSQTVSSAGGVISFPVTLLLNNTVYYWRVAPAGSNPHWDMFSFTYRNSATTGFEQSHFYQQTQSSMSNLILDSASRSMYFGTAEDNIFIKQGIYPYSGVEDADFSVSVNGGFIAQSACVGQSIVFNVMDAKTLAVYQNNSNPNGAAASCKASETQADFEFSMTSPAGRDSAAQFLTNYVHDGDYVVARSIDVADFAPVWAADSTYYGSSNTLYQILKNQGLAIDSYYFARCYIFVFKKNDAAHFAPVSVFSQGLYDAISLSQNIAVSDTAGVVTSPVFGPAKQWGSVNWQGGAANANNNTTLSVIGITKQGQGTTLFTIDKSQASVDISSVDASVYPNIMLQMSTHDPVTALPYQLKNWSVEYTPVPEGAIAPNLGIRLPDTLRFGAAGNNAVDTVQGYVAFKNVSLSAFDSLQVQLVLFDTTGASYTFPVNATTKLAAGDTVNVSFAANLNALPQGWYNFYLVVNPNGAQPEQFLFNNSLYKYIYISRSATALPVQLISFSGQPQDKEVMLNWSVANEINFSYYAVEWSTDGRSFTQLGTVDANGTGTGTGVSVYNFLHTNPADGANYYRLKLADKDGNFTYSQVIKINFGGDVEIKAYPNPFTSVLNVSVNNNTNSQNTIRLYDMSGRQIVQQIFTGNSSSLNVANLVNAAYLLQVNYGSSIKTFKVIKQ